MSLFALAACASPEVEPVERPALRLELRSDFWVDLESYLLSEGAQALRHARDAAPEPMSAEERPELDYLEGHFKHLGQRALSFDRMQADVYALLAARPEDGDPGLVRSGMERHMRALGTAAPLFREHVWPERSRQSEAWITATQRALAPIATRVADELATALQLTWPAEPVLLEIAAGSRANFAFSSATPPAGFAALGTIDPVQEGGSRAAVEAVVHQTLHAFDEKLVLWIEEASAESNVEPPPELWHALLIFTAGWITERALEQPGSFRATLAAWYGKGTMEALDRCWLPYLEGRAERRSALAKLLQASAASQQGYLHTQIGRLAACSTFAVLSSPQPLRAY